MPANKYLIDTSAWIEYFLGTHLSRKVQAILQNPSNECYTCGSVIGELASTLTRHGTSYKEPFQFIKSRCQFLEGSPEDYAGAGVLHAELKKETERISYTDALLITLSQKHELKIVTKDFHLKRHNALFLE
ncbi:MAG: PIN domain-containing protein [Candidatus Diapherotrites archaeon]|nr:PIN domain-containing protein [Candidatus Diapherotrites archaeon]